MVERGSLPASTARRADVAGVLLVAALALWTIVAGGRSTPIVSLLAGLLGAVAMGRHLRRWPGLVPKAVAIAIAGALLVTYPGLLGAGGAPTGYANSNATLGAIGVLAAAAAARHEPPGPLRLAWSAVALVLVVATLLTRSVAGTVVLVAVGALALLSVHLRWAPIAAAGGAITVALALGVTTAMAVGDSFPLAGTDLVRVELWSAAVDLAGEDPGRGLGAGAFEVRNPVTDDADLRWVHHEYLEIAVELGAVGLLLLVAIGLVALLRLAVAGRDGVVGAGALTVVALHGTVDHVWHAPVVLLLAALLVGDVADAGPTGRGRQLSTSVAEERQDRF